MSRENCNNNNNQHKDNSNNNKIPNSNQYTFDSSEDVKEIMTGRSGEGEGEGTPYPDSDKHFIKDIKKVIKKWKDWWIKVNR